MPDFDCIVWPDLNERYLDALKEGTKWIIDNFNPSGIIVSGTIIIGKPDISSDFDVFVIHNNNFRQRIQKIFNSIPFEFFVNPPSSIIKNIKDEYKTRMQCTSHMFSTGHILLNKEGILDDLIANAEIYLNKQPEYNEKVAETLRYKAAVLLEDAIDIKERDVGMSNIFISDSVQALLDWFYYKEHLFLPRKKNLIVNTERINYEIGKYSRNVMESVQIEEKIDYLKRLADLTIMTHGFFEWESEREEVEIKEII